jgi:hypothetical protein
MQDVRSSATFHISKVVCAFYITKGVKPIAAYRLPICGCTKSGRLKSVVFAAEKYFSTGVCVT